MKTYNRRRIYSIMLINSVQDDADTLKDLAKSLQDLFLGELLRWHQPGWILIADVLKAVGLPHLKRLNPTTNVAGHDPKASQTLLF
jgi:hypothetical protein